MSFLNHHGGTENTEKKKSAKRNHSSRSPISWWRGKIACGASFKLCVLCASVVKMASLQAAVALEIIP
jgi:hypothetical protein